MRWDGLGWDGMERLRKSYSLREEMAANPKRTNGCKEDSAADIPYPMSSQSPKQTTWIQVSWGLHVEQGVTV